MVRLIEDETHRARTSFKQVVNNALRRGLSPQPPRRASERYRFTPHAGVLAPGIDPGHLNRLVDQLEDDVLVEGLRRSGS